MNAGKSENDGGEHGLHGGEHFLQIGVQEIRGDRLGGIAESCKTHTKQRFHFSKSLVKILFSRFKMFCVIEKNEKSPKHSANGVKSRIC